MLSAGSPYEPFAFIISTFIRLFVALIRFDARPACLLLSLSLPLSLNFHFIRFALTDPPTVSVHLANEDPSRMVTRAEGQNVTFKCRADARPPVTSYSWFKNVSRPALIPIPPLSPSRYPTTADAYRAADTLAIFIINCQSLRFSSCCCCRHSCGKLKQTLCGLI